VADEKKLMGEFLSQLDSTDKLKAYVEDPEKAMTDFGLDDAQRKTLTSNNLDKIRHAIHKEYAKAEDVWLLPFPVQHIMAPQNILAPPPDEG
jgi:ribosomal protein L16/L10AE